MATHLTYLHTNNTETLNVVLLKDSGHTSAWSGSAWSAAVTYDPDNITTYVQAGALADADGYVYGWDLTSLPVGDWMAYLSIQTGAAAEIDDTILATRLLGWSGTAVKTISGLSTGTQVDSVQSTITAVGTTLDGVVTAVAAIPTNSEHAAAMTVVTDATTEIAGDTDTLITAVAAVAAQVTTVDTVADGIKAVTDKVDTALVADGDVYQFTANALELAPTELGTGSSTYTLTITDGTDPLNGVYVLVTTDAAGSNDIVSGTTNASGQIAFLLNPGSYYTWKQLSGYDFTNPGTITVT